MASSVLPEMGRWLDLAWKRAGAPWSGEGAGGTMGKGKAQFGLWVCGRHCGLENDLRKVAISEHWWRTALEKSKEIAPAFMCPIQLCSREMEKYCNAKKVKER